ncbi:winged helix-turn-helix domain-containing protein [Terrihabitans sp. B22-R8]|uniref:winged helix-turn-helix domain-containing protein n=1 Tax=Terrihabitans sp. B22-R8 TaxID=3425128 RepID=UPI00403C47F5
MSRLQIRLYFDDGSWMGPGKAALLEAIAEHGSISAAGRAMNMSYKRAWDLVAEMNRIFGAPVALGHLGGRSGGGAELTPLGRDVLAHFRAMELAAAKAASLHMQSLEQMRRTPNDTHPEKGEA